MPCWKIRKTIENLGILQIGVNSVSEMSIGFDPDYKNILE